MTFEGCKGAPCKCAAAGVICFCIYAAGQHDQFCDQQHRPTYCNLVRDVAHGSHHEPITRIKLHTSVIPSTSSSSDGMTKTDFFIRWVT